MQPFDTSFILKGLPSAAWHAFGWLFSAWYMWVFIAVVVAMRLGPELYESWRLRKAGMPEIDQMTGLEFEKYLAILFTRLGYQVERIRYVGDQGGDLILVKGRERVLVQAKRHARRIGNRVVQEATAARPYYSCDRAMVVANQEFTAAVTRKRPGSGPGKPRGAMGSAQAGRNRPIGPSGHCRRCAPVSQRGPSTPPDVTCASRAGVPAAPANLPTF